MARGWGTLLRVGSSSEREIIFVQPFACLEWHLRSHDQHCIVTSCAQMMQLPKRVSI